MNFQPGQNISCNFKNGQFIVDGTVIRVIQPRQALTELEMKEYASLEKGDRNYKSVEGASCSVQRLVLETVKGYTIVPVNNRMWTFELIEKNKLEKCPCCGSKAQLLDGSTMGFEIRFGQFKVTCSKCALRTAWVSSKAQAVKTWNRRK